MPSSSPAIQLETDDFDASDQRPEDLVGRRIAARYTLLAHLGGGGMADVFRARDDELGIDVAIKLQKPGIATPEMRARMVQEAQVAAQVRHPNLVRVYGTGTFDNTAYIAMELLDGPNLEDHLRSLPDQRLPWRAALELLLPAFDALHAVHERGMTHRDIKPANILVAREPGGPPRAVIIDLGLVKVAPSLRHATSPPTTQTGRVLCTPGFTSPEHASGQPVDRRSDVYSMGITLYRALSGRLPFHEARGKPMFVVFHHHIHAEPTRLLAAAAGADIPSKLAAVIESALAKDPNDRPQTMRAFAEALEAAVDPTTPGERPPFYLWPYGVAVATLLLTLLGVWMNSVAESRQAAAAPRATRPPRHLPPVTPKAPPRDPAPAPAPLPDPVESQPQPAPIPAAATSEQPRRPDPAAAARRAVARQTDVVQRCADTAAGGLERLTVAIRIDALGHLSARVAGTADSPLNRCLDRALRQTPVPAPPKPISFVHTFKLTAPRRP